MIVLLSIATALAGDFYIYNVNLIPIVGSTIEKGSLLVKDGRISDVGKDIEPPKDIPHIDGNNQWLMPGIIDVHSHMGVYPWPGARAHSDGNESIHPYTPHVRAQDSIRVEDPAFALARSGGVTTLMVLPGSANLIGGEAAIIKNRPAQTLKDLRFEGAPRGIKMACGENPKRVYRDDTDGPSTRMGNLAMMRGIFQEALDYRAARQRKDPPPMDHKMEMILDVLDGEIRVHVHCYRHDDIEGIYRVMDEYGIKVASFQHALEAYKVRKMIIEHDTAIATWSDWWGFKMEAYEATPYNAAMVKRDGGVVALHSDDSTLVQSMHLEATKMLRYGATEQEVLEMITLDPAKLLGVENRVGSLEIGKDADLALFSEHPLSGYTLVNKTWIDGQLVYDRYPDTLNMSEGEIK
ncbi:MAG: amidohydrolase [Proteobacteria bacterium]|nr:amidohydrolase [Pseudomonadota bacterium]